MTNHISAAGLPASSVHPSAAGYAGLAASYPAILSAAGYTGLTAASSHFPAASSAGLAAGSGQLSAGSRAGLAASSDEVSGAADHAGLAAVLFRLSADKSLLIRILVSQ
jgi:hypothetical protein